MWPVINMRARKINRPQTPRLKAVRPRGTQRQSLRAFQGKDQKPV